MKKATFIVRARRMTLPMRLIRNDKSDTNNIVQDVTGPYWMMSDMLTFRLHGSRLHTIRAS